MKKNKNLKILIINPFGIGDILFSTPLIRNIKVCYPNSFIAFMCGERTALILENNPHIDEVIPFTRGDFKRYYKKNKITALKKIFPVFLKIIRYRFNMCLDLSLEHRYSLVLKILGVKKRIGYNFKKRGRFLTHKIDIDGYKDKHVVEYNLELLKFLDCKVNYTNMEFFLSDEQKEWANKFLKSKGIEDKDLLLGIAPFGGEAFGNEGWRKQWPQENYAHLCNLVAEKYKAKIVIFAGPKEKKDVIHLISLLNYNNIIETTCNSLVEVASIIYNCHILIANDTGPLRFANALGIPSIGIFGPTDEKVYGLYPKDIKNITMARDLSCRPCYKSFRLSECKNDNLCLKKIKVEEVLEAAEKIIR